MNEHVVVRGIAGPLNGEVRRLPAGDTWRVGTPPLLLLTMLGEGSVRVDPLHDGVRLAGRTLLGAETLSLTDAALTLELPDGSTLWMTRSTAPLPTATPDATEFELELDGPAAAPTPPGRHRGWRIPRPRLRLPHISLPWRVSRAVVTSLAVHAVLAAILFLVLLLSPQDERPGRGAIRIRFASAGAPGAAPEDRDGTARPETPAAGDAADAPERSDDRRVDDQDRDELATALDAEAGPGADAERDSDSTGISAAPAGALLAARIGGRERLLREGGGDAATEGALSLALGWLARHQSLDGTWGAREFGASCRAGDSCPGVGDRAYREATTALALLPFLGAGHTHRAGPWRGTVRDGLAALVRMQRDDGSFATDTKRAYASAISALVLSEAYGLTGSDALRAPAQRAVSYFIDRQSDSGGWRYQPGNGKADTSVTGWVTLALVSARRGGLDVPARSLDGCRRWMGAQTAKDGLVGYVGRGRGTDALLGVGLFSRYVLGADATGPALAPTARRLAGRLPAWPADLGPTGYGTRDPMHWYYGSLAAYQAGGDAWLMWEPRLRRMLLENQEHDGCRAGSFDAVGSTGSHGGRVVVTALCALCLEVTYRYPRATFGR